MIGARCPCRARPEFRPVPKPCDDDLLLAGARASNTRAAAVMTVLFGALAAFLIGVAAWARLREGTVVLVGVGGVFALFAVPLARAWRRNASRSIRIVDGTTLDLRLPAEPGRPLPLHTVVPLADIVEVVTRTEYAGRLATIAQHAWSLRLRDGRVLLLGTDTPMQAAEIGQAATRLAQRIGSPVVDLGAVDVPTRWGRMQAPPPWHVDAVLAPEVAQRRARRARIAAWAVAASFSFVVLARACAQAD